MKVLQLIPHYRPAFQYGGPIYSVHNLAVGLVEQGVDVEVWTTNLGIKGREDVPLGKKVVIDGVKVYYFPVIGNFHYAFSPSMLRYLKENITKFDIVHIQGIYQFHSLIGGFYARKYKIPYVLSPRGMLLPEVVNMKGKFKKEIYINLIEKKNTEKADILHCTTEDEKKGLYKLNFNPQKIAVIPNGTELFKINGTEKCNVSFREIYGLKDKFVILFLGRLNWKKGLDLLIPAFSKVNKKHINSHLIIAGPDNEGYINKIKEWIKQYNIKNEVTFTGFLEGINKYLALRESDIFVLPSYSENFGMSVIEAMLYGLPVIVTKRVGIWSVLESYNCGKIVDLNSESISEAIMSLIENKRERINMGKRAKVIAEREFSIKKVAKKMIEAYERVM